MEVSINAALIYENITTDPSFSPWIVTFRQGDMIIADGDLSDELYVLLEGDLSLEKNGNQLFRINTPGEVFGEMAMLLEGHRTAGVRCITDARVLKVLKEDLESFFAKVPQVSTRIAQLLAHRLSRATDRVQGLQEFADHIPEAVVLTDDDARIVFINNKAEILFGLARDDAYERPAEELFVVPADYDNILAKIEQTGEVSERLVEARHPMKSDIFVSANASAQFDATGNLQGYVFTCRDVSSHHKMIKRYKTFVKLFLPLAALLAVVLIGLVAGLPLLSKSYRVLEERRNAFRGLVAEDAVALVRQIESNSTSHQDIIAKHFTLMKPHHFDYRGVVLLNRDKQVTAFLPLGGDAPQIKVGASYGAASFNISSDVQYSFLILYHVDKKHPMGRKSLELAFPVRDDGWVVILLNEEDLKRDFGIDENDLDNLDFSTWLGGNIDGR